MADDVSMRISYTNPFKYVFDRSSRVRLPLSYEQCPVQLPSNSRVYVPLVSSISLLVVKAKNVS
jgi:hypothetical protein